MGIHSIQLLRHTQLTLIAFLRSLNELVYWKSFGSGGYILFKEGHVQKAYANPLTGDIHLKAICLPKMKKDLAYIL